MPNPVATALCLVCIVGCAAAVRVYPFRNDPHQNPAVARHWVKPPDIAGNSTRFCGYRGGCAPADLDRYAATGLGDVVWPQYPFLRQPELPAVLADLRSRKLVLMDISNYVPGDTDVCDGSPPASDGVCEYHLPPATLLQLEQAMGDLFTGMDNGEQDGRYTAYAAQMPRGGSSTRADHFVHFSDHFDRMADDLGNKLQALNSLFFPHYFAQTGFYTMLGAETAQALPNAQLFYAFLRGAAKQHGQKWWGNASVWNRWGYKICNTTDACTASGTSLALLKRLLYVQLMYNCDVFGFEAFLTTAANELTPLGRIQKAGRDFVQAQGDVGAMLTSVAVVTDFYSGFTPPRHLYTGDLYRVWASALDYSTGDYWLDAVFGHLYPTYREASYYHNELGFLSPTPHGDGTDVLLSDAPVWLLQRYPVVVFGLAPQTDRLEVRDKLTRYVETGGVLVITVDTVAALSPFLNITANRDGCTRLPAYTPVVNSLLNGSVVSETELFGFNVCDVTPPVDAVVAARTVAPGAPPLAYRVSYGKGYAVVFTTSGVASDLAITPPLRSVEDMPLPQPHPMLAHVTTLLADTVAQQQPFATDPSLSHVATRRAPGRYLLTVANNELTQRPLGLRSNLGAITALRELALDQSEKYVPGYYPTGFENASLGNSTADAIAGLDIRVFELQVNDSGAQIIAPDAPAPPAFLALPIAPSSNVREALLHRPSAAQKYDAVVVDWRYLEARDTETLRAEARWAFMRGFRWIVDFSSGTNLYPDLRLCRNSVAQYNRSVERIGAVFAKMGSPLDLVPAKADAQVSGDAVLTLHRTPENYYSDAQTLTDFIGAFQSLAAAGLRQNVTLHLRLAQGKPPASAALAAAFLQQVGASNLRLAPSTALLLGEGIRSPAELARRGVTTAMIGLWFVAGLVTDPLTLQPRSASGPLAMAPAEDIAATRALLASAPAARPVIDAALPDGSASPERVDAEYLEWKAVVAP